MYTLIFTGGAAPSFCNIKKFLQTYNVRDFIDGIIAADSGIDTLISFQDYLKKENLEINLFPEVILGDMDSVSSDTYKKLYEKSEFLPFNIDKDYTDTELALENAAVRHPSSKIVLIGGDGGRPDHFLQLVDNLSQENHASFWLLGEQVICYLEAEKSYKFTGLLEKDNISFMRLMSTHKEGIIESKGLKWEGNLFRKTGMASISNRIDLEKGEEIIVTVKDAPFIVFLPYGAKIESV